MFRAPYKPLKSLQGGGKRKYSTRKDSVLLSRIINTNHKYGEEDPSHYRAALLEPLSYLSGQARIPDLLSAPTQTATFQLELTTTGIATNSGSGPNCWGGVLELCTGALSYLEETTASLDSAITFNTNATNNSNIYSTGSNNILPGWYSAIQQYTGSRIVAAGMQVEFIGNDSNNQGQITSCFRASTEAEDNGSFVSTSQVGLENSRNNYTGPAKFGTYIKYKPCDVLDLTFGSTAQTSSSTRRINTTNGCKQYGSLQWHATNLASTAQFRITIRVHLEAFAGSEVVGEDTGETCINPDSMEQSFQTAARSTNAGRAMDIETHNELVDQFQTPQGRMNAGKKILKHYRSYKKRKLF